MKDILLRYLLELIIEAPIGIALVAMALAVRSDADRSLIDFLLGAGVMWLTVLAYRGVFGQLLVVPLLRYLLLKFGTTNVWALSVVNFLTMSLLILIIVLWMMNSQPHGALVFFAVGLVAVAVSPFIAQPVIKVVVAAVEGE